MKVEIIILRDVYLKKLILKFTPETNTNSLIVISGVLWPSELLLCLCGESILLGSCVSDRPAAVGIRQSG